MKSLFAVLILLLVIFVYFFDAATFRGFWITGDLGYSDLTDCYWQIKRFLSDSLKEGRLPLWCPDLLLGIPLLSEGEMGTFYPLNFFSFLLLPPYIAYNLTTLLTFLIAGLATYLFCREIGLNFAPSILASVVFTLSGYLITHVKHPSNIQTASLFPLLLYFGERFIKEQRLIFPILAGVVLSFQIFTGHPQVMVYTNLIFVLYFILRVLTSLSLKKKRKENIAIGIIYKASLLPIMVIIGLGLSACQLFPTMELLEQSGRKIGGAIHELDRFPFHYSELVRFILPYFYGDPYLANHKTPWDGLFWENTGYIGILPLILSCLAIARIKTNRYILVLTIILVLSLILSFGKYSPLFFLLKLPPLSSYRFPNRFLLIVGFSLAILSAFGLEEIGKRIKSRARHLLFFLIISIVFLDLFKFGSHHNPTISAKKWLKPPESVKFLKQNIGMDRVYSVGSVITRNNLYFTYGWKNSDVYLKHREVLSASTNLEHGLQSPGIYLTFFPIRPYIFEMRLAGIALDSASYTGEVSPDILRLLSLLNVKYLVSCFSLNLPIVEEIKLDWQLPSVKIYENRDVFPRAYVVGKSFFVQDPNTIINILSSDWFNPRKMVILEEQGPLGSEDIGFSDCKILKYKDDRVEISAKMTKPGYLVLTDSNYPGWKAYVDKKEAHIYYANCAFRAVFLEEGEHKVEFRYCPDSFKKGAAITIATIFLIVLAMLFLRLRKYNRRGTRAQRINLFLL
jgi:hypothetical protein